MSIITSRISLMNGPDSAPFTPLASREPRKRRAASSVEKTPREMALSGRIDMSLTPWRRSCAMFVSAARRSRTAGTNTQWRVISSMRRSTSRSPSLSAANASRALGMSAPTIPENSTHAAPARLCTVCRVCSAVRAATIGGVTATIRTSSRLRSRDEKSAFSVCERSHRWTPKADAARRSTKKRRRDTNAAVAGDQHEPLEDEVLTVGWRHGERGGDLHDRASRKNDTARRAAALGHRARHALDGARAGVHGAAGDRVRRALRDVAGGPLREAQPRGTAVEAAAHERGAGDDDPAEEAPVAGEGVDREGGAGIDHQLVAGLRVMRRDERGPAVGPELLRIAVAIDHSELLAHRADERKWNVGRLAGPLDPELDFGSRHVRGTAHLHGKRGTQRLYEIVRLLRRNGAPRLPRVPIVDAPLDTGIAGVDGENDGHFPRTQISADH